MMKNKYCNKLVSKCLLGFLLMLSLCISVEAHEFTIHKNIVWASPNNTPLTVDIYVPETGKKSYPVVVIYHGGGWLINTNAIMNSMSEYIASHSEFVVANINYRVLPANNNTTTMNQIVEDAFGGLLWVKDNIKKYKGDPKHIAITGDSAGGHLTTMILTSGRNLSSDGFTGKTFGFNPTYLPKGQTAEKIAQKDGMKVQAAVVSYGAFDLYNSAKNKDFETPTNIFWKIAKAEPRGMFGSAINVNDNPDYYRAVSPIYHIPPATDYKLPQQFVHVGSKDNSTPPDSIKHYVELLESAGQPVEFKMYAGLNHAFLDSGCNQSLGSCFDKDAIAPLNDIIAFLQKTLK